MGGGTGLNVAMGQFGRNNEYGSNWSPYSSGELVSPVDIGVTFVDVIVDLFSIPWANYAKGFIIRIYRPAKQYTKIRVRMYYYNHNNSVGTTSVTATNCTVSTVTDATSGRTFDCTYDVTDMTGDYAEINVGGIGDECLWGGVTVVSAS